MWNNGINDDDGDLVQTSPDIDPLDSTVEELIKPDVVRIVLVDTVTDGVGTSISAIPSSLRAENDTPANALDSAILMPRRQA